MTNISSLAGQTVTLSFNVNNGGDADALLQSSLALDNISLSSVPEPGSAGLLAGVLTVAALRRRRGESV